MDDPAATTSRCFEPDRAAGLAALQAFLPYAGDHYARLRNYDFGPDKRGNVSRLSPYIRHRLITEAEVIHAVLADHGTAADKFVQEIFWRTYWKGWLEMRPSIWADWQAACAQLSDAAAEIQAAARGRTGIACFDAWAQELVETGYLHNHARMWFASIWIFTLGLPWQLGAAFFLRHLIDGDPASNTLSWRWVAGLQTPGKTYLATPENIATFSDGRFQPERLRHGPPPPLVENPLPAPLPPADVAPSGPALLLLHEEDLHPESLCLMDAGIGGVAALPPTAGNISPIVRAFRHRALEDALERAERFFATKAQSIALDAVVDHARAIGAKTIMTAYAPVGPTADMLRAVQAACRIAGLSFARIGRPWDEQAWPLATKGFFAFRQHIPQLAPR